MLIQKKPFAAVGQLVALAVTGGGGGRAGGDTAILALIPAAQMVVLNCRTFGSPVFSSEG